MFIFKYLIYFLPFLAWTYTFDTATPADDSVSHPPSQGATRIREIKEALQERLNVDHYFPLTGTQVSDAEAGYHRQITLVEAADIGTGAEGRPILGAQTVSGKAELVFTDEDDNDIQITSAGSLMSSVPSGGIIIWSGLIANIPSGYYICDGNNGTPDLLDRMLKSVETAVDDPGDTGGSDTHTHLVSGTTADSTYSGTGDAGVSVGYTKHPHSHAVSITSASGSTLPKYYTVAFIMKS